MRPSPSSTLFQRSARDKITAGLATILSTLGENRARKPSFERIHKPVLQNTQRAPNQCCGYGWEPSELRQMGK